MPRIIKRTVILLKIETTPGVDAVPTGAANAMYVADLTITPLDATNIELNYVRPYFGASESLVGPASIKCSFKVYLGGSGTAATAPAWGQALQAAAMAETLGLTVPNRVEYQTVSDLLKTVTIYWYDDGVLHKLLGAFADLELMANSGEAPAYKFSFTGIDGGISAATNPATVLTAWKTPPPVTKATVTDLTFGCTYSAGALVGGTQMSSKGLSLSFGHQVAFNALLSNETVVLTDRKVSGKIMVDLTAAQEVANMALVKANTLQGLGFIVGSVSGNRTLHFMPAVQLIKPTKEDFNGQRLIGYELRVLPVSGNDEYRCVSL